MNTVKLQFCHYEYPREGIFVEYMNRDETKERIASGNLFVTQQIEAEENFATDDIVGIVKDIYKEHNTLDTVEIEPMNGCESIFENSFCVPCGRFVDDKDYILWRLEVCSNEYTANDEEDIDNLNDMLGYMDELIDVEENKE